MESGELARAIEAIRNPNVAPRLAASACSLFSGDTCYLGEPAGPHYCATCPYRGSEPMPEFTVLIPARNEHGEVGLTSTVKSIIEAEPKANISIIDDGSDRPLTLPFSAKGLTMKRHDEPMGISGSRHELVDETTKGHWCYLVDAHMEFPPKLISHAVRLAQVQNCLAYVGCRDMGQTSGGHLAADLKIENGLMVAKWADYELAQRTRIRRSTACMGAGYAIEKARLDEMGGWPVMPGPWGCDEEYISLLCAFHGIPILAITDLQTNHKFQKSQGDTTQDLPVCPYTYPRAMFYVNVACMYHTLFADWQTWRARLRRTGIPEQCIKVIETPEWDEYGNEVRERFKVSETEFWLDWLEVLFGRDKP